MSRFDYVHYNDASVLKQTLLKRLFEDLENQVMANIPAGRAQSIIMTKLEEAYMWVGKGIRDAQVAEYPQTSLNETRSES